MNCIGKKLYNEVENCADDALEGFSLLYPGLELHHGYRFMSRKEVNSSESVALLSGGGSGHEPFSTGYVGKGMLAGAVAGSVFASPPKGHIIYAIRHLSRFYGGGVIIIIPNYTGDCLNFGMAAEQAKSENLVVDTFVFGDDCASGQKSITGRRGMCGLTLAYKIGGALAAIGKNMAYIMNTLKDLQKNISTLGISLNACSLPGQVPLFSVADGEMELGTGVHGEAGIGKIKMTSARGAVEIVLEKLIAHLNLAKDGDSVVVLVNNLGATSQLEQNIICKEVHHQLHMAGIEVKRMYAGMLMTSLDMSGFQVSLLKLPPALEVEWLASLDEKTDAPCWAGTLHSIPVPKVDREKINYKTPLKKENSLFLLTTEEQNLFKKCLHNATKIIKENEGKLNELDSGCGDGDCGSTLKNFAEGIQQALPTIDFRCPAKVLRILSEIAETKMGGTSGAVYSLGFTSMSKYLMSSQVEKLPVAWAHAMKIGVQTIMKYGRVDRGYRTVVDALLPAVETFYGEICVNSPNTAIALSKGVLAAENGCNATKTMKARAGRASYVSDDRLTDVDAGAYGFTLWLKAIGNCF